MKKLLFIFLTSITLVACSSKVYNSQLKEVQLGMTKSEVVHLMGDKYTEYDPVDKYGTYYEMIEYKDRYKNVWVFEFKDGRLEKWSNKK